MKEYYIKIQRFTHKEVLQILLDTSTQFQPPLSKNVELVNWSAKLAECAQFVTCRTQDNKIACIAAFYRNEALKQLYIPYIVTYAGYRRKGLARKVIVHLSDIYYPAFKSIALEVRKDNIPAYRFYTTLGFEPCESRGHKDLMVLRLPRQVQL